LDKKKSFMAKAKSWIGKNKLHGPHAFLRFVMLVFVQRLNEGTDEFIFKGGNLLWLYIKTPRSTVDADFATRSLNRHEDVKRLLEAACAKHDEAIAFSVLSFQALEKKNSRGAEVSIQYVTKEGQKNSFDLDIVYAVPSATTKIESPIDPHSAIAVVTIENIVADKLSACQQFKGGNTRMKDFDDLWRISRFENAVIDWKSLRNILESRGIEANLDLKWLNDLMEKSWTSHKSRNKGLPENLPKLMAEVNDWLKDGLHN
jgi:predicted nucleotidyltransferase component of viral defense system